jgi:nucleotide-binding universal stress UspA family protein
MKIVVGYDGSDAATRALRRAADFAFHGAQLRVVTAARVAALVRDPAMGTSALDPAERDARAKALAEARSLIADLGVEASFVTGTGDPADVLLQEAEETGADLIIVGTHGKNVAERLVLGSVSTKVLHHARCDVLIVR